MVFPGQMMALSSICSFIVSFVCSRPRGRGRGGVGDQRRGGGGGERRGREGAEGQPRRDTDTARETRAWAGCRDRCHRVGHPGAAMPVVRAAECVRRGRRRQAQEGGAGASRASRAGGAPRRDGDKM